MAITFRKLKNEVLEPVSYYMKKFDGTFSMSRHYHPYLEFMYCQSGQFAFEVYEEEDGKKQFNLYTIAAGAFVVIDAMVPHRIITETEAMIYNVEFEVKTKSEYNPYGIFDVLSVNYASIMGQGGWQQIAAAKNGYSIVTDMENVEFCARSFLAELYDGVKNFEQALSVQSKQIMLLAEIGKCKSVGKPSGCLWYIKRVWEYINRNYASDIKIEEIAASVSLSKAYLQRIFRAYTGSTILQSINEARVNRAKQLLRETNLSVGQIVSQAGFKNSQHLIYEFKRTAGITPSEYRREIQQRKVNHQMLTHDSGPFREDLEEI